MAKTNKRQRKKNAKTKQRKGTLYVPQGQYRGNITIKGVDIDPNNKYQQELLSVAQFNLYQLQVYLRDRVELDAIDIDTLKWLAGNEFIKIFDDIRNWARYDPNHYKNAGIGRVSNIISITISKYFDHLNHASGRRIISAITHAYKDIKSNIEKYTKGKKPKNNAFVIVYYEDVDL